MIGYESSCFVFRLNLYFSRRHLLIRLNNISYKNRTSWAFKLLLVDNDSLSTISRSIFALGICSWACNSLKFSVVVRLEVLFFLTQQGGDNNNDDTKLPLCGLHTTRTQDTWAIEGRRVDMEGRWRLPYHYSQLTDCFSHFYKATIRKEDGSIPYTKLALFNTPTCNPYWDQE